MHWDCFSSHGDIGCIIKHKAWAKMNKIVYMSEATKAAYPLEAEAIATCAAWDCSDTVIMQEEKKQSYIDKALSQPKHAAKYVWHISKSERDDYMGLKNIFQ